MPPQNPNIAISVLSHAHSPDTTTRIFTEKIKQRPLHLKPTDATGTANAQQQRRTERLRKISTRKKKLKPAPLSSRQKRALCLYEIPKSTQKYAFYEPLHKLWIGYIQEVLGLVSEAGAAAKRRQITTTDAAKLCSADFHGAEVEVVRSRCVSRVGVRGIVVKDSMRVFEIATKRDQIKVVPKEGTIFRFCVPVPEKKMDREENENGEEKGLGEIEKRKGLVFELHGDQFIYRAADRANRKFKSHFLPGL